MSQSAITPAQGSGRTGLRPPPRVPVEALPKPIQDLVATWHVSLAEDFKGLTADGVPHPELFKLVPTGVSTRPVTQTARAFLDTLDAQQRQRLHFDVTSRTWRTWSNIHRNIMRHGVCLAEMDERQRDALFAFTATALGARAQETMRNAMRLNEHLASLNGLYDEYGEGFYWISFFGEPSLSEPWGWQMDGHHVNISCLLVGDQMVLSPMLLGAEPVTAESEPYKGVTVLREEEAEGWAFMDALSEAQQTQAIIGQDLPFDGYASGFKDNAVIPFAGLRAAGMTEAQRSRLARLIARYTDRLRKEHAAIWQSDVEAWLEETWFAWIGAHDPVSPFYYRVHSPVIFIEFYHQPGVALPNTGYSRRHAHALMRTPNGNDYGRALLSQYHLRTG